MQTFNERLGMARRKIQAMKHKRFTVYARHAVNIEGYNVAYIDNNVNHTVKVAE